VVRHFENKQITTIFAHIQSQIYLVKVNENSVQIELVFFLLTKHLQLLATKQNPTFFAHTNVHLTHVDLFSNNNVALLPHLQYQ
jgi:hypothetical protein